MNEQLIKQAQLGIESESFLNSDIGKYIMSRAGMEFDEGVDGLLAVDPTDTAKIIKLQSQCIRASTLRQWLIDAIDSGLYAEEELKDE